MVHESDTKGSSEDQNKPALNAATVGITDIEIERGTAVGDAESCTPKSISRDDIPEHRTPHDVAQSGVLGIEAITKVWSKTSLALALVLIWVVYFIMLLQQNVAGALVPYITSAFSLHSLTPTVSILSSVVGGVCNLTVAKFLDVLGRPHGYAISLGVATIGLVMMAATTSVEMYAAAQVFLTVGSNSLLFTVSIIVADMSSLRNRTLVTAIASSPNIIVIWIAGPIAESFLNGPGWQWCLGMCAILVPVACLPLLGLLFFNYHLAKKQGLVKSGRGEKSAGTASQPTWTTTSLYYLREFDALGLLLLTVGLCMILLPFNLWALQPLGWQSPLVIGLLVGGVCTIATFVLWERYWAPVTFIPYSLLLDRNVVGGCLLGMMLFISYYVWFSLFGSFLQVVSGLSVTQSSYVLQAYGLGGSIFALVAGLVIRYTGRYKTMTLYVAIPAYALFTGLLIHLRQPNSPWGLILMCQIFLSAAAGVLMSTPQLAAMAIADHQHVAAIIAIVSMSSSIGGAVGSTASGAIWQAIFPLRLAEYLPLEEQANMVEIYASIDTQLSYPMGSPTRLAIQEAYGDAQAAMLAVATGVWVVAAVAVAFWRDIDLRTRDQVKGQIF